MKCIKSYGYFLLLLVLMKYFYFARDLAPTNLLPWIQRNYLTGNSLSRIGPSGITDAHAKDLTPGEDNVLKDVLVYIQIITK